ncbi:hypothetical protein KFK09_027317 [Dendrobium nobile]|uniref:Terpene synthase metal-binding domain-containing protein n=1 Tax=Dendrobium nobile TaxID=94219 RepID=A0A8T3AAR4_DENNO|nr:hypothetical protein KFK09_027317 [Dendrobium nobile]
MKHLKYHDRSLLSSQLVEQIEHALELPLHWRMSRLHTRWFIDAYGRHKNFNPTLLEFAKLDFNMVQSIYKTELQELSRWWRNVNVNRGELNFVRDRLVENYLWAIGFTFQPELWRIRKETTKINSLITTIDDIYDIYGTLDELKLFTNAIEESNIAATQQLPDYMKKCLTTLFNTMDDIASSFSREKELDILPCLKRMSYAAPPSEICRNIAGPPRDVRVLPHHRWNYVAALPNHQGMSGFYRTTIGPPRAPELCQTIIIPSKDIEAPSKQGVPLTQKCHCQNTAGYLSALGPPPARSYAGITILSTSVAYHGPSDLPY